MSIRTFAAAAAIALVFVGAGCYSAPIMPPSGFLFSDINAPATLEATTLGSRRGESHSTAVLGLVAWGNAGVNAAARNGNIREIRHIDYEYRNVLLGIYQRFTTVVYGE